MTLSAVGLCRVQVPEYPLDSLDVIPEQADTPIASGAQPAADLVGLVTVVQVKSIVGFPRPGRLVPTYVTLGSTRVSQDLFNRETRGLGQLPCRITRTACPATSLLFGHLMAVRTRLRTRLTSHQTTVGVVAGTRAVVPPLALLRPRGPGTVNSRDRIPASSFAAWRGLRGSTHLPPPLHLPSADPTCSQPRSEPGDPHQTIR